MTKKTERLVKDVAALFAKYSVPDWQPILEELQRTGSYAPLADAIRDHAELAARAPKPRRARVKSAKSRSTARRPAKVGVAPELEVFRDAMIARRILSGSAELRAAADAIGIKDDLPANRRQSVDLIVRHLASLPNDAQLSALRCLAASAGRVKTDQGAEYERWAALIMRPKTL
jgi:hypothetical protein